MVVGCDAAESTEIGCAFGESYGIAESEGPSFDGVALASAGDGAWLVWSERSGTYARRLGPHGAPEADARRLGPACPGGVAALEHDGALLVACVTPGDRDRDREGTLLLSRVTDEVTLLGRVAPVADESRDPDLAAEGNRVLVGWRDADAFAARARVAELGPEGLGEPWTLSSEETLSSAPSLRFIDGALHFAWTESWFHQGRPAGHLLVRREGDPPRPSLGVNDIDVHTQLTADARGPLVTLRDRRGRSTQHRSFAGRLDADLRLTTDAIHSPARADANDGHPMIVPCGPYLFSVTTRRSSREVTMVSLRRLDADLEPLEGEQQIYEYHARFPQAVGVCVDDRLLVAVGERETDVQPRPRLRTYELVCGPGRVHARTPGTEGQVLRYRARTP
ncbi:MAG: hypothetical protein H6719_01860 [Sandaracinaceae bacterium]|nr:hypothetical protein [Sandaracinaceae bacterium]